MSMFNLEPHQLTIDLHRNLTLGCLDGPAIRDGATAMKLADPFRRTLNKYASDADAQITAAGSL
jgi:hypothetical protein